MKEYLPIGTVVILSEGQKTIMIYGRKQLHAKTNMLYDYVACLYPEGNIDEEYIYLFNHDQIGEIVFTGYINEEEEKFLAFIDKAYRTLINNEGADDV